MSHNGVAAKWNRDGARGPRGLLRRGASGLSAALAAAALLGASAGCSMTHAERKAKAEEHWGEVRAGLKLQMARQQFDRGFIDEATKLIDEALAWDRENAEAYLLLARCRLEDGKLAAAERAIALAVEYGPGDHSGIAATQGLVAERRGNYAAALEHYRRARKLDDTRVDYAISEAECLVAMSQTREARALITTLLPDYDNDPSLLALLGEIALRDGDKAAALQAFRNVLAAGRYDPVIAEEFALLAVRAGQYHDALAVLEPLMAKQAPGDLPASVLRAASECMLALHRPEPAKKWLRLAVERNSEDAQAWLLLARAGIATGDAHTTRRAADQLQRLAPQDPQSLLIESYACVQEGHLAKAQATLRSALQRNSQDALALCMLGLIAERVDDFASAHSYYEQALRADPTCTWAQAALKRLDVALTAAPATALADPAPAAFVEAAAVSGSAGGAKPQ